MNKLLTLTDTKDLYKYLDIEEKELRYLLYECPWSIKYNSFNVLKRNGKTRLINSPNIRIKRLQEILKNDLLEIYGEKECVQGFVKNKNILTNASKHINKTILINIDLENFFDTIHFGRIRGLFLKYPFNLPEKIATILSQICCFNGKLPQGAPTSPIISNFICRKLDNDLLNFARKNSFIYSRYADDISFSTYRNTLTDKLGYYNENNLILSSHFSNIITNNNFVINNDKVRISFKNRKQCVTGLIVNKGVNIERKYLREVRAILNAIEKHGVNQAAVVHFNKNNITYQKLRNPIEYFLKRIVGKISFIGFIKGKNNPTFQKLYHRIKLIVPTARLSIIYNRLENLNNTLILTEGKTDWKHVKAALVRFHKAGKFLDLTCEFADYLDEHKVSNSELLKLCESLPKIGMSKNKVICVFDRDDKNFIPKVTSSASFYKDWTNNIYSIVLPKPNHRNFDSICIEHFYLDDDLSTYDHNFRRIFLSTEFDENGKFKAKKDEYSFHGKKEKLLDRFPFIIDSKVMDKNEKSVALSKNDFAEYILNNTPNFANFNIDAFELLFENILKIQNINNNIQ